jgi:hypothetical protein
MLTIVVRSDTMSWGRKGALLLLAVGVFWTALPVSACLLAKQIPTQKDCCRAMARDCSAPGSVSNTSCCKTTRQDDAVSPVPPYSPEHSQKLSVVPGTGILLSPQQTLVSLNRVAFETPPPKPSPGGNSKLQI